jgi:excisionase family DNA binding protein
MAGMFYSLKEAAQKLGKTEDQVKRLVKENKLREFRDGSNLLFTVQEVDALLAEGAGAGADDLELQDLPLGEEPIEAVEGADAPDLGAGLEEDIFQLDEAATPAEGDATTDLDLIPGLEEQEQPAEAAEEQTAGGTAADEDLFVAEDLEPPAIQAGEGSSEEISLAPESGILAGGSDITDMDTALTGEGINVLAGTDADNVTEDSMAETVGPAASAGTSAEASLEEIEDDVNLDSFGSGSGLLDLSLQADDTSLGGILDEIYTAEGGEGEATPAEGAEVEADAEAGAAASFDEITAEAEHVSAEEELTVPEPVAAMPAAMGAALIEVAPDAQSNILGMLLFLPLLALLYTAIVVVAGMQKIMPSILSSVQGFIWYLMGGAAVLTLIVFGASFAAGREKAPKAAKPAKEKAKVEKSKVKAEKPSKEAAAKPAKEKKSFFGKKKK